MRRLDVRRGYIETRPRRRRFPDRSNRFAFTTKPTAASRAVPVTHRRRRSIPVHCSRPCTAYPPITADDNPRATAWNFTTALPVEYRVRGCACSSSTRPRRSEGPAVNQKRGRISGNEMGERQKERKREREMGGGEMKGKRKKGREEKRGSILGYGERGSVRWMVQESVGTRVRRPPCPARFVNISGVSRSVAR